MSYPFDPYISPAPVSLLRAMKNKKPVVKKPQQVQKSKFANTAQQINRDQKLAVTAERVKNEKAYNIMQQARALDNKIKRSKQPSYEDLQEFHKLSQAMEDIVWVNKWKNKGVRNFY